MSRSLYLLPFVLVSAAGFLVFHGTKIEPPSQDSPRPQTVRGPAGKSARRPPAPPRESATGIPSPGQIFEMSAADWTDYFQHRPGQPLTPGIRGELATLVGDLQAMRSSGRPLADPEIQTYLQAIPILLAEDEGDQAGPGPQPPLHFDPRQPEG